MKKDRIFITFKCENYDCASSDTPCCGGEVKFRNSLTEYPFDGVKDSLDDPNRRIVLCEEHFEEYVAYWQDMWSNVERG